MNQEIKKLNYHITEQKKDNDMIAELGKMETNIDV